MVNMRIWKEIAVIEGERRRGRKERESKDVVLISTEKIEGS